MGAGSGGRGTGNVGSASVAPPPQHRRRHARAADASTVALHAAVVFAAACAPYLSNIARRTWAYDDKATVLNNGDVAGSGLGPHGPLSDLLKHDFWGNAMWAERVVGADAGGDDTDAVKRWTHESWRPLTVLTLRADYSRAYSGGSDPPSYAHPRTVEPLPFHVTNVVIHGVASLVAFVLCRRLWAATSRGSGGLSDGARQAAGDTWSFVAALLFALHPIHTEVVSNVTGRAESLCAVFALGAAIVYGGAMDAAARPGVRSLRSWILFGVACALTWLSVMCKETGLVTPCLMLAWEVCSAHGAGGGDPDNDDGGGGRDGSNGRGSGFAASLVARVARALRRTRVWLVIAVTVTLLYGRVVWMSGGYQLRAAPLHNSVANIPDRWQRAQTIFFVQMKALRLLAFPWDMAHEHTPIAAVTGVDDARLWASVATAVAAVVLPLWLARRNGRSSSGAWRVCFAVAMLVIPYFPASHIALYVAFVLAERTLFLSSLGAAMLAAELAVAAGCRLPSLYDDVAVLDDRTCGDTVGGTLLTYGVVKGQQSRQASPPGVSATTATTAAVSMSGCAWAAVVALCLAFTARIVARNRDWECDRTLMEAHLRVYPDNSMSRYGLGYDMAASGEWDVAEDTLQKAVLGSSL